jgi:hypothetical protein
MNVLFIGNSFTARNNLPALVAQLAAAAGQRLDHKLINQGGASLRMHWNKGEAQKAIATKKFEFVVLQEQSTLPVKNAARMRENILLFDQAIKAAGAKTALYMTWARRNAPDSQKAITDAYTSAARETGATLIPAGLAWEKFLARHDKPILHDRDNSHPTLAGSYLAACVAVAVLFKLDPSELEPPIGGLTQGEMQILQQTAASVVPV